MGDENENSDLERTAYARFGGGWIFKNATRLDIGGAITGEGPGKGVTLTPWCLDHYEGVLGLKPGESWLLRRMLAHAWTYKGPVFLSIRKISIETGVSRFTIHAYVKRLVELGLIIRTERDEPNPKDRRVCYDVSPTYKRLALAIACDPTSNWARDHGGPLTTDEIKELNNCIDLAKVERLARRRRSRRHTDE